MSICHTGTGPNQGPTLGFVTVLQPINDIDTKSTVLKQYRPYVKAKFFLGGRHIHFMLAHTC